MDLPKAKRPVDCKWVSNVKYKADETMERYKACIVVKGYTQTDGIDYIDICTGGKAQYHTSPLVFRSQFGLAISTTLNIKNAFLNGELQEKVLMTLPPCFYLNEENRVCKLKQSLYGLKQSLGAWFDRFAKVLKSQSYLQGQSDHIMFF